jgi:5-methyltetrahydropteroyltriglutamate--homocysteine methyltransferase
MNLILSSTGGYPRIGDTAELQVLRRTLAAADRGEKTAADLVYAESAMTRRAIEEQVRAGLDLVTDGQIRWQDPISHLAGKLRGVKIGGLLRFLDTNTYFRQPVLTARPERAGFLIVEEFRFACNALGAIATPAGKAGRLAVKAVLTGPHTLARCSLAESPAMSELESRTEAYAAALAAEIPALADSGAELIQLDEPAILRHPRDWAVFARAFGLLAGARDAARKKKARLELALHVYFHDPAPLYEKLLELPADVLGLDFTYGPGLLEKVAALGANKPLALGLVDSRNTKVEDPSEVARQLERVLPKISGGRAYLAPSSGLEYLPRDRARAKLDLLGRVRAALDGRSLGASEEPR